MYNVCQLLLHNRAAANGRGGSPSRLCRHVVALVAGRFANTLAQERGKTMGVVCVYIVEILLELTLGPTVVDLIMRRLKNNYF